MIRPKAEGQDPASVAFESVEAAIKADADIVIIDTAGRLQNKTDLMGELDKIRRVVEKQAKISEVLLVLDATTGQNGMSQAKAFADQLQHHQRIETAGQGCFRRQGVAVGVDPDIPGGTGKACISRRSRPTGGPV